MVLRFNEGRATEAATKLLKLRGGRMSYLKLIKLLTCPVFLYQV
jgi:hypothetical protein